MIYRIHYTVISNIYKDYEDSFDVEGDSIEEIKKESNKQEEKRGLTLEKNNLWSEEIVK